MCAMAVMTDGFATTCAATIPVLYFADHLLAVNIYSVDAAYYSVYALMIFLIFVPAIFPLLTLASAWLPFVLRRSAWVLHPVRRFRPTAPPAPEPAAFPDRFGTALDPSNFLG